MSAPLEWAIQYNRPHFEGGELVAGEWEILTDYGTFDTEAKAENTYYDLMDIRDNFKVTLTIKSTESAILNAVQSVAIVRNTKYRVVQREVTDWNAHAYLGS